jgi:hypothetical protein
MKLWCCHTIHGSPSGVVKIKKIPDFCKRAPYSRSGAIKDQKLTNPEMESPTRPHVYQAVSKEGCGGKGVGRHLENVDGGVGRSSRQAQMCIKEETFRLVASWPRGNQK